VAPVWEVGEIATYGLALSRPRRGFESRWGHHNERAGGPIPRPVGRAAWIRGLGASDAIIYLKEISPAGHTLSDK